MNACSRAVSSTEMKEEITVEVIASLLKDEKDWISMCDDDPAHGIISNLGLYEIRFNGPNLDTYPGLKDISHQNLETVSVVAARSGVMTVPTLSSKLITACMSDHGYAQRIWLSSKGIGSAQPSQQGLALSSFCKAYVV
jgi:hypothetical protein